MKIVLVAGAISEEHQRLQPQRTLLEMGRQLEQAGHEVAYISDRSEDSSDSPISDLTVLRVRTVRTHTGSGNRELTRTIASERPDVILWHMSLAGLLHQGPRLPFACPTIAIVTSPVQPIGQILRVGPRDLASNLDLIGVQLAGALLPAALVRRRVRQVGWSAMVTLSEATRARLIALGVPEASIHVVSPGVSPRWFRTAPSEGERAEIRARLGYAPSSVVATYFGSPAPVRGIFTLLRAVEEVAPSEPRLRMMILSRRTPDQWMRQAKRLRSWVARPTLGRVVRLDEGFLAESELVERIVASDVVVLPFEVVPSDVPLSILEAMALGKCVVATRVASIPELLSENRGMLIAPGSVQELTRTLRQALTAPDELAARGQRARTFVRHNRTWDDMGTSLESVLKALPKFDGTDL